MPFQWAQNKSKLERAIKAVGSDMDEQAVRDWYIKLGGNVISTKDVKIPAKTISEPKAKATK